MGPSGLEPPTLRLSVVRSSQLSYGPVVGRNSASLASAFGQSSYRSVLPPLRFKPASLGFETIWITGVTLFTFRSPGVRRPSVSRSETLPEGQFTCPEDFNRSRAPTKPTVLWDGGDSRVRTGDLLLARQALSQLSYIPFYLHKGQCPLN